MLPQRHPLMGTDFGGPGRLRAAARKKIMKLVFLMATAFPVVFGASAASAAGVERLYVLDCGRLSAPDQSRWSPGVNVGVPIELSDNCYLIRHTQGWFLWDTGLTDCLH